MIVRGVVVNKLRIVIADDHEEVRWLMIRLLARECEIVGSAADGRKLVDAVTVLRPDVIVSDISMPVLTGPEAMGELRTGGLDIPFVLASINMCSIGLADLIHEGAMAFVDKMDMGYDLLPAVRAAIMGQVYFSRGVRSWIMQQSAARETGGHVPPYYH
jgi:DNA-binding NarL/FixJ family response regulator